MDEPAHEYKKRIVNEGKVGVSRTAACDECGGTHVVGLLRTATGASNVNNILGALERLNGKVVRITIEWDESEGR